MKSWVLLIGLEARTCPSRGLSQQRMTSHLRSAWIPHSRSALAGRRGWQEGRGEHRPRGNQEASAACAVWAALSQGTASLAFTWFNKPSKDSAKRAAHVREYQARQYFLVIVQGKCLPHS